MSNWASRRKAIYFWSTVLVLTAVSFFIFWNFWYRAPTCSDGFQNGDETGIDCGGSCSRVCALEAQKPITRSDPRIFKVIDNVYSVIAFVENHNLNFKAPYVPYKFKIYDAKNKLLYEREGATVFHKNRTISIFEGNILIPNAEPKRAEIELPKTITWVQSNDDEPELDVRSSSLLREDTQPRIEAKVTNKSIDDLNNIELVAVVFDGRENAIAASRTFIDRLNKNSEANIFFTWPKPFDLGVIACTEPSDVVLALDRSGSMAALKKNPPEPLQSVKNAASLFIQELKDGDRGALVSFATEAHAHSSLVSDLKTIISTISSLSIKTDGTQYTNISDAINKSAEVFTLSSDEDSANKIIILLTDGVATRPDDPKGSKTEEAQIAFAENAARLSAALAKQSGVTIYTIGLGENIHEQFLREIASKPENYFNSPSTTTLTSIYSTISSSICTEKPAKIEITYKVLGK